MLLTENPFNNMQCWSRFSYDSSVYSFGIEDLGLIESLPNFEVFRLANLQM